jgi:hypothetical protein
MILDFLYQLVNRAAVFLKVWGVALAIGVVLVLALGVTYYRWKGQIRRAAQAELLNQQQAGDIAKLRAGAQASGAQASAHDARIRELAGQLDKSAVRSQQLTAQLAAAVEREKQARAEIGKLSGPEVAQQVTQALGPSDQRTIGPSEDQGRKILEIIGERNACQEQSLLKDQQLANCEERNSMFNVQRSELLAQVGDLQQAYDLEKRAFDARDELAKKQLKGARGSWAQRAWEKIDGPVLFLAGVGVTALVKR